MELKLDLSELKTYAGHESSIVEFVPKRNNTKQTKGKEKIESGHCGDEDTPKPQSPLDETVIQLAETMNEIKVWMRKVAVNDGPMTREEAAEYLKVCPRTMYELVKQGAVKCYYIGPKRNQMRFRKKDLDTYMDACAVRSYEELAM